MNRRIVYFLFVLCAAVVAQIVSAQDTLPTPVPDPVPNVDVYGGPLDNLRDSIIERIEKRMDERQKQDTVEMAGLLDRLRQRDDISAKEFASIRDWFKTREESEAQRYHGIRGMLEQIRDRPQLDTSGLFPRIAELRSDIKSVREVQDSIEMGTGPIREALGMLVNLVYGLILLAGVLLMVDVYRTFFRRA